MSREKWDCEGATAVEYAIVVSLIAVVIISAVVLLGGNVRELHCEPSAELAEHVDGVTTCDD